MQRTSLLVDGGFNEFGDACKTPASEPAAFVSGSQALPRGRPWSVVRLCLTFGYLAFLPPVP